MEKFFQTNINLSVMKNPHSLNYAQQGVRKLFFEYYVPKMRQQFDKILGRCVWTAIGVVIISGLIASIFWLTLLAAAVGTIGLIGAVLLAGKIIFSCQNKSYEVVFNQRIKDSEVWHFHLLKGNLDRYERIRKEYPPLIRALEQHPLQLSEQLIVYDESGPIAVKDICACNVPRVLALAKHVLTEAEKQYNQTMQYLDLAETKKALPLAS